MGLIWGGVFSLTKTEKEILGLIQKGYFSASAIANKRGTSTQAVYKIIKRLKEKGYLEICNLKGRPTPKKIKPLIRLHGQHINIRILHNSRTYRNILKKSNLMHIDNNTIRLHKSSINIYSNISFFADTPESATHKSIKYWEAFIRRLENEFNLILIKPRYQNIKIIRSHYSETNNELAKDKILGKDKITIRCKDSGKLWFIIDNSFNLHEAEFIHPDTAEDDITKFKAFMDDLRNNDLTLISELKGLITEVIKNQVEDRQHIRALILASQMNTETLKALLDLTNSFLKPLQPQDNHSQKEDKPDYIN